MKNEQVIKLYLSRTKGEGENAGCTLFFIDFDLYSYSTKLLLAKISVGNLGKIVYVNYEKTTPATSKQRALLIKIAIKEGYQIISL